MNRLQWAFDWLVNCTWFCTPSIQLIFLRLLGLAIKTWEFSKVLFHVRVTQQFITRGSSWIEREQDELVHRCWGIIGKETAGSLLLLISSKPISGFVSRQNHEKGRGRERWTASTIWKHLKSINLVSNTWSSVAGYTKNSQRKRDGLRLKIEFLFKNF